MRSFISAVTKHYATFSGRMSRKDYWTFILVFVAISVVFEAIEIMLLTLYGGKIIFLLISDVYYIALLSPLVSAGVRRLHDTGRKCLWMVLALIPVIGWIVLIMLLSEHGDAEENRYGPPAA